MGSEQSIIITHGEIMKELKKHFHLPDVLLNLVGSYIVHSPEDEIKEAFKKDSQQAEGLAEILFEDKRRYEPRDLLEIFVKLPVLSNIKLALTIKKKWKLNGEDIIHALIYEEGWNDTISQWSLFLQSNNEESIRDNYTSMIYLYFGTQPWFQLSLTSSYKWHLIRCSAEIYGIRYSCGCQQRLSYRLCPSHEHSCSDLWCQLHLHDEYSLSS